MSDTHVLLVAANPAVSTTTGWPVGFWASELTHPWYEFSEVGYKLTIASPKGGVIEPDALSDPRDASGYSAKDLISRGFLETPALAALLDDTVRLSDVDLDSYDAIVVCGGQAPMFTFRDDADIKSALAHFYEAGKTTAALCHGVAALIDVEVDDGYLISGKTMTGFANVEEAAVDAIVGQKVMPWHIEDAARERGAEYVEGGLWQPFAVRDGNLITGQQQYSGRAVAELVIAALTAESGQ
ncbi:MAG: type 1 glutamine amidotransferase domain-containing protein [Gaiellaceae bacterium MAG52_C11]|nr:type 1 glutamine amidotransferase domain-containing protein [Candidatus Gaiellasilicea maunaloa]